MKDVWHVQRGVPKFFHAHEEKCFNFLHKGKAKLLDALDFKKFKELRLSKTAGVMRKPLSSVFHYCLVFYSCFLLVIFEVQV